MHGRNSMMYYPAGWYFLGQGMVYLALVMMPAMLAHWVGSLVPETLQPGGKLIAEVVLLPIAYWGEYELLRRARARAQNFIYLLVLFFGLLAAMHLYTASDNGDWQRLVMGAVMALYAVLFAWMAYRGSLANRTEAAAAYKWQQEEQINLQAQAILRAQDLGRQRPAHLE